MDLNQLGRGFHTSIVIYPAGEGMANRVEAAKQKGLHPLFRIILSNLNTH